MNRTLFVVLSMVLEICCPAFAANVATVQTMDGQIAINRGNGYEQVVSFTDGHTGDQVMASPGGYGKIIYSDGCVVNVKPGAVVTVQEESPCGMGGAALGHPYLIGGAIVAGVTVGIVALSGGGDNNGHHHEKPASP